MHIVFYLIKIDCFNDNSLKKKYIVTRTYGWYFLNVVLDLQSDASATRRWFAHFKG